MKKLLVTSLALGVAGMATTALAIISGTPHDIPGAGTYKGGPASDEPCAYCHTPHGAYGSTGAGITNDLQAPLWDHQTTVASFTTYVNTFGTIDATDLPGAGTLPDGVAKACLSCHDGTVAVDSYHGSTGANKITAGTALIGTDLSNDHPVSFTYNTALATADGELYDPATTPAVANLLLNNKVECGSCHDVHNAGFNKFLVMSNAASALCLTCHNK